tara:strand:- start:753 stop:1415 length:663 start_codon:yes stop_codon:yes gene_type:complete
MKKILLGFIAIGLLTFVGCGTSSSFSSVKIGVQDWMSMNLNVERFRNGDIIPEAKTKKDWEKAGLEGRPAWCYYDNDISNGEKYGKLYNWHAVSDPRGLTPEGWHVPTDAEWTVLTDYLATDGHIGTEGTVLKSTSGWNDKRDGTSGNGTNVYGWNGLPGGGLNGNGSFYGVGSYGSWWSSSLSNASDAWSRNLNYSSDYVYRNASFSKENGFSVRCLRD